MMKRQNRITLYAKNAEGRDGFHLYLDFSGQREYLMTHRGNTAIYQLLKDGLSLAALRRMTPAELHAKSFRRKHWNKTQNSLNHILLVADDYIADRQAA